ncbi:MAG: threonine synthase, partial [Planctomycetales bacterium]|nr:threonine synthase [Planctomycetales bacterium]
MPLTDVAYQQCISPSCQATYGVEQVLTACPKCRGLLDVRYDWDRAQPPRSLRHFEEMWSRRHEPLRFSGVWRFHELLPFAKPETVVTVGEGQTLLQQADSVAEFVGVDRGRLYLQYEGMNPSGSFKDNGM